MLTPDQEALLLWVKAQPDGVTLTQMEQEKAPCFNRRRLKNLYDDKLLYRNGAGVYMLSDLGAQVLLEHEQHRQEAAEKAAQNDREHHFQIKLTLIGAVATGFLSALFSLLFQQLSELIRALIKQG